MAMNGKGVLERGAAADLWRHTLSQIPTIFGRLVYLSSLRDPNTGRYEHHGLSLIFGEDESDRALRKSHGKVFAEWLRSSLEHQKADLELYLSELSGGKKAILGTWLQLAPYRNMIPVSARRVEKRLYLSDLETLLELLRNAHGVVCPDPDS